MQWQRLVSGPGRLYIQSTASGSVRLLLDVLLRSTQTNTLVTHNGVQASHINFSTKLIARQNPPFPPNSGTRTYTQRTMDE